MNNKLHGSHSLKSLHKLDELNISISSFREVEKNKMCHKVVYQVILTNFGPFDPLKSPLHYQRSTLKGSYFPIRLHKLLLSENGSISIVFEVKLTEKCQICHISFNFDCLGQVT